MPDHRGISGGRWPVICCEDQTSKSFSHPMGNKEHKPTRPGRLKPAGTARVPNWFGLPKLLAGVRGSEARRGFWNSDPAAVSGWMGPDLFCDSHHQYMKTASFPYQPSRGGSAMWQCHLLWLRCHMRQQAKTRMMSLWWFNGCCLIATARIMRQLPPVRVLHTNATDPTAVSHTK
jgi:hypothetical protein